MGLEFAAGFSLFAFILCVGAAILNAQAEKWGLMVLMIFLALSNLGCFIWDIYRLEHPEDVKPQKKTVENVIQFQVDSTTTINGADTTKTYQLTYWK